MKVTSIGELPTLGPSAAQSAGSGRTLGSSEGPQRQARLRARWQARSPPWVIRPGPSVVILVGGWGSRCGKVCGRWAFGKKGVHVGWTSGNRN